MRTHSLDPQWLQRGLDALAAAVSACDSEFHSLAPTIVWVCDTVVTASTMPDASAFVRSCFSSTF
jgi:hypothetical protein